MDYKSKHENIAKIISKMNFENFLESLSAIEYNLSIPVSETPKCLVPLEPNFQLPNIFLKTKLSFKSDKILNNESMKANFNKGINKIIEFLDSIELEDIDDKGGLPCDERILEDLIRWRRGSN